MASDPQRAQLEAAFSDLQSPVQVYVLSQGKLHDNLLSLLKRDAMYFLRWESARQEGRSGDMDRIEKSKKHIAFKAYLAAGGKIPHCDHRIHFESGKSTPIVTPLVLDQSAAEQQQDVAPMPKVQARKLTPRLRTTIPPNPQPVVTPPAPVREDKSLEHNDQRDAVPPNAGPPNYGMRHDPPPPARAEARSNSGSNAGTILFAGIAIIAIVALIAGTLLFMQNRDLSARLASIPTAAPANIGNQQTLTPNNIGNQNNVNGSNPNSVGGSPAPNTDTSNIGSSFNPSLFSEQSCSPNEKCIWDIGAMGNHWSEALQRNVVQVAIIKGTKISWNGNTARALTASNGENRCSLVVIPPNNWLENVTMTDVNRATYDVWEGDPAGWMKTLAVQAAQEQTADYGCPQRNYPEDFDIWGSNIPSPPCGVEGFVNCTDGSINPASSAPAASNGPMASGSTSSCDTADCQPRMATADNGGKISFAAGDAVLGSKITLDGGKPQGPCYFSKAPAAGTVVDGVDHYWNTELQAQHLQACQ